MKSVRNSDQLSEIIIGGYKFIAHCKLKMGLLNVLVGANGAGKSNFFRLIADILDHCPQLRVDKFSGPEALLH